MNQDKSLKYAAWCALLAWLIIIVLIVTSCASYRTEPYKPSMNPAKAYQKEYGVKHKR